MYNKINSVPFVRELNLRTQERQNALIFNSVTSNNSNYYQKQLIEQQQELNQIKNLMTCYCHIFTTYLNLIVFLDIPQYQILAFIIYFCGCPLYPMLSVMTHQNLYQFYYFFPSQNNTLLIIIFFLCFPNKKDEQISRSQHELKNMSKKRIIQKNNLNRWSVQSADKHMKKKPEILCSQSSVDIRFVIPAL